VKARRCYFCDLIITLLLIRSVKSAIQLMTTKEINLVGPSRKKNTKEDNVKKGRKEGNRRKWRKSEAKGNPSMRMSTTYM